MKLSRRTAISGAIAAVFASKVETVFGFIQSQLEKRKLKAWTSRLEEHVHPSPDGPTGPPTATLEGYSDDPGASISGELSGFIEDDENWRERLRAKREGSTIKLDLRT